MKRLSLLVIFLIGCAEDEQPFQLTEETYEMWQEFIKPTKAELAWAEIPWRNTFYDGLIESDIKQKPLLLWAMNGDPLGCTLNNGTAGRRSVWSDPRLIEISKNFIPATDEVWRLQGVVDKDASIFQEMANKGHYRKAGGSRQGIYVCSPNGSLLASVNSLDPDVVLETIKKGLDKWKELPEKDRQ